ncbi:MAG: hypothetical protein HY842_17325 [Bacteroidetes bacterium]|nr:hypothetical protein [Bacteroidota bacterium]
MKKTICIALLAFFASQTFAQRWNGGDETLFNRNHRGGFFVAPIVEFSDFENDMTTANGGGLAFVAGDLFFGAYGLGVTNYDNLINENFDRLEMGHGGFWLGYTVPQHRVVHAFTSVKAGWGAVNINFDGEPDYEDAFFAVTPEAGLEVNVFRWLRVAGAVGYRFMNGLDDSTTFNKDDLQTMTGSLTIRIGGFGRRHERYDD